jgi:hypothetical protein
MMVVVTMTEIYYYEVRVVLEKGSLNLKNEILEQGPFPVTAHKYDTIIVDMGDRFVRIADTKDAYRSYSKHDALLDEDAVVSHRGDSLYGTCLWYNTYSSGKINKSELKDKLDTIIQTEFRPEFDLSFMEE